jgi:hypothetical protein
MTQTVDSITYDPDHLAENGTSGTDYKLWLDYLYDWVGATPERVLRTVLFSVALGAGLFVVGLLASTPFDLAQLYVSQPASYILPIWVAYALYALRWVSQQYHRRAYMMRPCFAISNAEFRQISVKLAEKATDPGAILRPTIILTAALWIYMAVIGFAPLPVSKRVGVLYPDLVPNIHATHTNFFHIVLVALTVAVFILVAVTCIQVSRTLIRLLDRFATLPTVQVPSLVIASADGILNLSVNGAVLFGLGIVLLELAFKLQYRSVLDLPGYTLVLAALLQGLLVFFLPRRSATRIWKRAREELVKRAINEYWQQAAQVSATQEIVQLSNLLQAELNSTRNTITLTGLFQLVVGQLVVIAPIVLTTQFQSVLYQLTSHLAL